MEVFCREWESDVVFLGGGTTGGTDILAAIIQKYLHHYSIAQIMQFIDGAVVVVGMYVFGVERALYAIIAVFLVTKVSDGIIEGLKFSKAVYIITDKPDEVAKIVMEDLGSWNHRDFSKGNVLRKG